MLKTAMVFGNGMVLQRGKPVPVWGTAEPGSTIEVTLDHETIAVTADEKGNWQAILSAHEAAEGLAMTLKCGSELVEYTDIAVGEVWVAGGQSNMEYLLGFEANYDDVLASFESSKIRFFDYPETAYDGALEDWNYVNEGFWRYATKKDLAYFSAVGFYFAKELQADLNVPVGIIGCNWGGTPASAWMDPERLRGTPGEAWIRDYEQAVRDLDMEQFLEEFKRNPANDRTRMLEDPAMDRIMRIGLTRAEQEAMKAVMVPVPVNYERRPGGLYEAMLRKIVPYAIRGVIWYQGETDGDFHPDLYTDVFSAMIANWRDIWHEELPFLFVQLAPFSEWLTCFGKNYGIVRTCQEAVSKQVPNTWMATSGDVGMEWDIHPKNKKPLGERLALLARGHVYGESILCDPPEAVKAARDGHAICVTFEHAQGLYIEGGSLKAVQAVLEDGSTVSAADAQVQGDCLILNGVENAKTVALGATDYYEVNLYNRAHIPAKPFLLQVER